MSQLDTLHEILIRIDKVLLTFVLTPLYGLRQSGLLTTLNKSVRT